MGSGPIKKNLDRLVRPIANCHLQGSAPNVYLFSTPRSGSTWLMEIIGAERFMKPCNEPFNIRKDEVAAAIGISDWAELEAPDALPRIEAYLREFEAGKLRVGFKNLRPFEYGYRPYTNRIVFKILHACENRLSWLRSSFKTQTVYLLRHPAPVSLSRTELPRLRSLIDSRLADEQKSFGREVLESGSDLERATLDWCLQNKPILDDLQHVDLVVTYEQMVVEPAVVVERLIDVLNLRSADEIMRGVERLSRSVAISDESRRELLEKRHESPCDLVTRWQRDVSAKEASSMSRILDKLEIDAYSTSSPWPTRRFWIEQADGTA